MKKWSLREYDSKKAEELKRNTDLSPLLCRILCARGITDVELATEYFRGEFYDPFDILDMDKAVDTIQQAIDNEEKITVYGDYDCDGITSTAILYTHLDAIGADVDWYIPTREEGYGLNKDAVKRLYDKGTRLIVTVDNGISAAREAEYIYELGMKLVITDHHQVPDELPRAEAIVNPHRKEDTSQYKFLCGCGIALKLIMALENDIDTIFEEYGIFAAIGTIGDVVALTGENRIIVKRGLEQLEYNENIGLNKLIEASGLDTEDITSSDIAYKISPRINAASRLGEAHLSLRLFLTQDEEEAHELAKQLCELNNSRVSIQDEIYSGAMDMLYKNHRIFNERVLIVYGNNWNHGIIGLVSARLCERFEKPVIVIGIENGEARGSARSVEGFSMIDCVRSGKKYLTRYGGHPSAAGFSLKEEDLPDFIEAVYKFARENYPVIPPVKITADLEPETEELTPGSIESLSLIQPVGEQNPGVRFLMKNCLITSKRSLKDGKFVRFVANYKGKEFTFLDFHSSFADFQYATGDKVDVICNAEINEYSGKISVRLLVCDIRYSGFKQERYFAAKDVYEKIVLLEKVDKRLEPRIIPTREDMKIPFDIIKKHTSLELAVNEAIRLGINYCKFMICLHIFAEFGHLRLDRINNQIEYIKGGRRIETEESKVIKMVKRSLA